MGRRHHKKYESSSESSCSESESSCSESENSYVSESELDEVEHKLNKKMERLYCQFLWKLRREPCLFVNGSEAHASVYSNTTHTTATGANIVFDLSQYATNIDYTNGNDFLVVRRTGLYAFTWTATFNEPCILGVFVNTILDTTTVVSNNSGATVTVGSQMLRLLTGDRIEIRNLGLNPLTSAPPAVNPLYTVTNFDFTLFKIGPNRDVCGDFPIPFEKGRCCDDVAKWNLADTNQDYQISACEEKQYHRDHRCPSPCPPPHSPPKHCSPKHSPKKCHSKDKKSEKKFKKLDKNDDGMLSYEEYKKQCERRHRHHKH
jgi:hypothetical protein